MKIPKISIIIPVYNAEKYLSRCLDSVLTQSFTDFEVVCVNDGSTDRSLEILVEYRKHDDRIRVINQHNKGVSRSRQVGIETAGGGYFIHCDPDDWVESDWLQALYDEATRTEADMVICDFERIYKDRTVYYCQKPTSIVCDDVLQDLLEEKIWGSCWNKLIRSELFKKYDIKFNPDMNLWEDLYVTCSLLIHNIKIAYVHKALYQYDSCINDNSIVRFRKDSHVRSGIIFIDTFEPILSSSRYQEGWFFRKCRIKKWIFTIKHSIYDIQETYSEINQIYIDQAKVLSPWNQKRLIALSIKGWPGIAHTIDSIKKFIHK